MITSELRIVLIFITSLFSVLFLIPKLARIATKIGLMDKPNHRKMHDSPRPLVGGIAMVISATFSFLLFIPLFGLRGYFVGVAILLLIGFLDDFKEIGHRQKFLAQILATAMLMYLSKTYLLSFGDLLGLGNLDIPVYPIIIWVVTIFCVVGVINALNLLDGLDGLAGGFSFIAFLTFSAHASLGGNKIIMLLNLALVGAVLGFLRYNWKKAQVFMGDAGSLCLGFSLAFMSLTLTQGEGAQMSPVCALLILAVPIVDTITVMTKRIIRGESPFKPDKYHLHHIFIRYGMSKEWAVRAILGITAILCAVSLLSPVYNLPDWTLFLVFFIYLVGYVIASFYIIFLMRFSQKMIRKRKRRIQAEAEPVKGIIWTFLTHLNFSKFFRKTERHAVDLKVVCLDSSGGEPVAGTIVNISSGGMMAQITDLRQLLDKVMLKISFKVDGQDHSIELPAKHLWLSQSNNSTYHGFEFSDIGGEQNDVVFGFMVKAKTDVSGYHKVIPPSF